MEYEFLKSLQVIFIASAAVILLLYKLKIPSLIGFIIAGVIIGPHGLGLIEDIHFIQILAEIGVILLLFTIGIEFSMTKLFRIRKAVLAGGGTQVLLTIGKGITSFPCPRYAVEFFREFRCDRCKDKSKKERIHAKPQ